MIFVLPFLVAIAAIDLLTPTTGRLSATVIACGATAIVLVAPMRDKGHLAWQDVLIGTRVVMRPGASPPMVAPAHHGRRARDQFPYRAYLVALGSRATDRGQILRAWDRSSNAGCGFTNSSRQCRLSFRPP